MSRHATPMRYPGGKQRLTPFIRDILAQNSLVGGHYAEPYAGGAGVAIELLLDGNVSHIHLNDSCRPIYAFWHSVVHCPEELCFRISAASLTVEEWKRRRDIVRMPDQHDLLEVGFSAFYLNRCNRSGVLSGGLIGGLAQSGRWNMDARFPQNELIRRIEAIALRRDAITVHNWDAERYITDYIPTLAENTLVYCDPPYYEKAGRLYPDHYRPEDHIRLARTIQEKLCRKWLVSYDAVTTILGLYRERRGFLYALQYNASAVHQGREVFIFSDDLSIPVTSQLGFVNVALEAGTELQLAHACAALAHQP